MVSRERSSNDEEARAHLFPSLRFHLLPVKTMALLLGQPRSCGRLLNNLPTLSSHLFIPSCSHRRLRSQRTRSTLLLPPPSPSSLFHPLLRPSCPSSTSSNHRLPTRRAHRRDLRFHPWRTSCAGEERPDQEGGKVRVRLVDEPKVPPYLWNRLFLLARLL